MSLLMLLCLYFYILLFKLFYSIFYKFIELLSVIFKKIFDVKSISVFYKFSISILKLKNSFFYKSCFLVTISYCFIRKPIIIS